MIDFEFTPSGAHTWRELYEIAAAGRDKAQQQAAEALALLSRSNDNTVNAMRVVALYVAARDAYEEESRRNWGPDKQLPYDHPILRNWIAAREGLRNLADSHAEYLKEFQK